MITVGQSKAKEERRKKKDMSREVAEGLILSKLFKDGFFVINEEAKTASVDARKGRIEGLYGEESYSDVIDIINRTAKGLTIGGYKVEIKRIDIVSS